VGKYRTRHRKPESSNDANPFGRRKFGAENPKTGNLRKAPEKEKHSKAIAGVFFVASRKLMPCISRLD
jgi:hypothetical protein